MLIQKILIVDDSPTERHFLTELLLANGYAVTTADKAKVEQVIKTGQTTEQAAGDTDRRDSNGNLPTHPPDLIPLEYKIAAGVGLVFVLALLVKKI